MQRKYKILVGTIIIIGTIIYILSNYTDFLGKSYSKNEIEFMARAEVGIEKYLREDVTVTDMRKGKYYAGPFIVSGIINRHTIPFELQTNEKLEVFEHIGTYHYKMLSKDAFLDLSSIAEGVFGEVLTFNVLMATGDTDYITKRSSYEEIKKKYGKNIIYNISMFRQNKRINKEQVKDEAQLIYKLIEEFKANDKKVRNLKVQYKNFAIQLYEMIDPSNPLKVEDIEEHISYNLEKDREKEKK